MNFTRNVYKCVTDIEFAKQFILNRLPDQIRKALNLTEKIDNSLQFTANNIDRIVLMMADLIPSIVSGEHIHVGRKIRVLCDLAFMFKVDINMLKSILNIHNLSLNTNIEAQGLTISKTWISLICALIMGVLPNPIVLRKVNETMKFFETFDRINNKQSWIEDMVKTLPETVQNLLFIQDIDVEGEINDKIQEISGFISLHREKKTSFYNTIEVRTFKNFRTWLDEQINCLALDNAAPKNLLNVLTRLKNELVDIKGKFIDEDFNPHPIEPFCIYLTGAPGVGKSSISRYIGAAINNQAEKVGQDNLFYVKNPGDQFCTGYTGQFCWIYDDFAQQVSSLDGLELIKYITPQRAPLNMASMNDPTIGIKGTKQQSLLFICCSNVSHPVFNNLEDQGAFLRRRHVVIEMLNNTTNPLHATFHYLNKFENRVSSADMDFKTLLTDLIDKYNYHMRCQTALRNQYIDSMADFGPDRLQVINNRVEIIAQGAENNERTWTDQDRQTLRRIFSSPMGQQLIVGDASPEVVDIYNRLYTDEEFLDARDTDSMPVNNAQVTVALVENKNYWKDLKGKIFQRIKSIMEAFKNFLLNPNKATLISITMGAIATYMAYKQRKYIGNPASFKDDDNIIIEGSSGHKNKESKHKQWLDQRNAQILLNRNAQKPSKFYDDYYDCTGDVCSEGSKNNLQSINKILSNSTDKLNIAIYTNGNREQYESIKTKCETQFVSKDKETGNKIVYKADFGNFIVDNNVKSLLNKSKESVESEGCEDQGAVNVTKLISQQILNITTLCYSGDQLVRSMTMSALPIKGHLIMAPRHLFMYQGKYMEGLIQISNKNVKMPDLEFDKNNIIEFPGEYGPSDIVLYYLGSRVRTFRDITNLFCTGNTLANLNTHFEVCLVKQQEGDIFNCFTRDTDMIVSQIKYDASGCPTVLGKVLQYNLSTEKGDCGSVAILYHPSSDGKIIGMHVAGALSIAKGFAKPVSRELLLERVNYAETKFGKQLNGSGIEKLKNVIISAEGKDIDVDVPIIGLMQESAFMATKTKYVPSEAFEMCGPHRCEPAILDPKDTRNKFNVSPLYLSVNKYAEHNKYIKQQYLNKIKTALPILFKNEIKKPLKTFTLDVLINGNDEKYIDPLNMKSSAGWPYKTSTDGKRHLFDLNENNRYVPRKELMSRLKERQELGYRGERISSIWTDCLKDETRPLDKIESVKTRSFCVAPVDFNIWLRHFTMDFRRRICENRISNGIAIGINPYSLEWTQLAHHLTEYSNTGYAGDYQGYDRLLHSELMDICLNFIFENLENQTELDNVFFKTLVNEIKFATCRVGKYVYIRSQGLPSGADLTATLNSMVGICYLFYAWLYTAPSNMQNVVSFINNVKYIVYGDDNMFFPRDSAKKFYNFASVQQALKEIGITYTPETKDDKISDARHLHDMMFLSNGFRPEGGFYKATLKMISIIEMTNWISNKIPSYQATKDNVNTALRFLYFYGFSVYQRFYKLWIEYADYTYDALDEIYMANGGFDDILNFCQEIIADIESQGNTVNHIQNMQGWSHIAKATLPSEVTGDKLDNKFKFSAMDKPAITLACAPTVLKDFQGLSNSTNIEYLNKLSLNPSSLQESTAGNTAEEIDEMALRVIGRRWGFIRGAFESSPWLKDTYLINDYALDPCYALAKASTTAVNISPMCAASMYNSFWRGSIEYKFIFFTDGFTTGKVCVDFRYGVYDTYVSPTFTSKRNSQYSVIMDVNPHKYIFHVKVPYMHASPWLSCRNANYAFSELTGYYETGVSMGMMHVSIINPFTGSGADRCKVRMNILERMGDDFELAGSFANNLTVVTEGLDNDIIGNNASYHVKMGEIAPSNGTVIDTIGSSQVESVNNFANSTLSMNDANITYEYFFNRWQQCGSSELITTNSTTDQYDIYSLMWKVDQWKNILMQYVYFRCVEAQIRVEVNGNPYCSGGLMVAHLPITSDADKILSITDHNIVNLQHGILNYNTTSSVTLDVPYINDTDFTHLVYQRNPSYVSQAGLIDNIRPLGTLIMNYSFAALQKIGNNPQSPSVAVYMKINGIALKIPISLTVPTRIRGKEKEAIESQGREGTMFNMDSEMIVVGEPYPLSKDVTIGDPVTSFRDVIKKYVPVQMFDETVSDIYFKARERKTYRIESLNTQPAASRNVNAINGHIRMMLQMYGLFRGGLRYKMRFVTVNSETETTTSVANTTLAEYCNSMKAKHPLKVVVAFSPRPDYSNADSMTLFADYFVNSKDQKFSSTCTYDITTTSGYLEFEVPFGVNSNWRTQKNNPMTCDAVSYIFMYNENNSDVKVNTTCLTAAADDLRFKGFLGVNKARVIKYAQEPDAYSSR